MTDASDTLKKAKERALYAKDAWSEIYNAAKEDLHFLSDAPYCQWDEAVAKDRTSVGRPVLQIDQLTQFVHQVSNDIRMNTPTINVIPVGMDSDSETAEAIQGRIKAIEYKSNADSAYDTAADFSVKSSIGFIRVDRGYVDEEGFNQEMKICRVVNPFAILLDPSSTEPDGSDAKWAFVFDEMSESEFKERYPDKEVVSFWDDTTETRKEGDKVVIAEYFSIEEEQKEIGLLDDGSTQPVSKKGKYKSKRKVSKRIVKHQTLSGAAILEETTFPGIYVPIVPVYGEEGWENGKRKLYSLIRKSKSAQYMFNLWASLETELLLKQQQAPVMAAAGQMKGFEDDWKKPDKAMVLYYNQEDLKGEKAPPPVRLEPPTIPTGIVNAKLETVDHIKSSMGLYNNSVGKADRETSGVAIQQREQQGDVATFHFGDNLVRAITHVGKIIVCALPEVEDTQRIVHTIGKEDEVKPIGINGQVVEGQEKSFNFTKGKYDVRVVTGPAYTTQRQEAAAMYMEVLKTLPPEVSVNILDLVFKYQDAPGSQALAERFKKMVDPKFLDEEEQGGVDPQVVALQGQLQEVMAQAQQEIQTLQAEVQNKQGEYEIKQAELQLKAGDQQLKSQSEMAKVELERAKLLLEEKKLEIEQQKLELDAYVAQKEPVQPPAQSQPTGIKLDTTGFQFSKTPEQEAMEAQEAEGKMMLEQQELQLKQAQLEASVQQTQAIIQAVAGIQEQLAQLTATVSQPITLQRDAQGNLIGAS